MLNLRLQINPKYEPLVALLALGAFTAIWFGGMRPFLAYMNALENRADLPAMQPHHYWLLALGFAAVLASLLLWECIDAGKRAARG